MIGKIHPPRTMFLREQVGTAEADGVTYSMTVGMSNMAPIIHSSKTGKYFTLSWEDILNLANKAGIDEEDAAVEPVQKI